MPKLFKEPLVQFLIGGLFLYVALAAFGPTSDEDDPYVIPVNDAALLMYLQYQDKAFDTASAKATLSSLDEAARSRLETEYIRDEVMVREALVLGLDNNDEVIRRRLIQKMDFIVQGFSATEQQFSEADLEAHFAENIADYMVEAEATFTHIFFSNEKHGTAEAEKLASEAIRSAATHSSGDKPITGDRFYFLRNYVKRPKGLIDDHFGSEMSGRIFASKASEQWIGPFKSKYGSHLVLLKEVAPAREPDLSEVASRVLDDLRRKHRDAARAAAITKLSEKYTLDHTEAQE